MRATYTLKRRNHPPIEYRRAARSGRGVLHLENRELKPDGTPHDDHWYPVDDSHLLWMQHPQHDGAGSDIIIRLCGEQNFEENPAAWEGITLDQYADLYRRGFSGKFPELTDAENNEIFKARVRGFGACYTAFPTAEAQARKTLAGARRFLDDWHTRGEMLKDERDAEMLANEPATHEATTDLF